LGARIATHRDRLAGFARTAGAMSAPVLVLAGLANRFDLMPFPAVLPVLLTGILLAIVALFTAIFALTRIWQFGGLGTGSAIAGIVYAIPGVLLAGIVIFAVIAYPRIADVTTDADNPPQFRVLHVNGANQDASDAGTGQGGGQPVEITGIAARHYPAGIDAVYDAVIAILANRGWAVASDSAPDGGRDIITIEASARTLLFAFADDLAIRLTGTPDGTRVDMRSASRWGRHDLGQNGRRIRAFMGELDLVLQGVFTRIEEPAEETEGEARDVPGDVPAAKPDGQAAQ